MPEAISVFFMDVSSSSTFQEQITLERYLEKWVNHLQDWTKNVNHMHVIHRRGDELLLVAEGTITAYILAYYLKCLWPFDQHRPYFGLAAGTVDAWADIDDLETWNHPAVKAARVALDDLKTQKRRQSMQFGFDASGQDTWFVKQANKWLTMEYRWTALQTDQQRAASALYFIAPKQQVIADLLGKDPSTVSRLLERGHVKTLQEIHHNVLELLTYTDHGFQSTVNDLSTVEKIQERVQQTLFAGEMGLFVERPPRG